MNHSSFRATSKRTRIETGDRVEQIPAPVTFRATSKRTRIETWEWCDLLVTDHETFRATSKRTRIETRIRRHYRECAENFQSNIQENKD